MYYLCRTCNQTWYYPLEKCVFCHEPVEPVLPQKYVVRGATEVYVPSREHRRVPYHILLVQDELGNMHSRKTYKNYRVGDEIDEPSAQGIKHAVTVTKVCYDLAGAFERLWKISGGIAFHPGQKVAVKLMLKKAATPASGCITDYRTVEHILQKALAGGIKAKDITLIERIPTTENEAALLQKSGFRDLCERTGVAFLNLSSQPHETISVSGTLFDIPKILLSIDFLMAVIPLELSIQDANALCSRSLAEIFGGSVFAKLDKAMRGDPAVLPPRAVLVDAQKAIIVHASGNEVKAQPKLLVWSDDFLAADKAVSRIFDVPAEPSVEQADFTLLGEELEVIKQSLAEKHREK